jgi:hypothetical protein
VLDPFLFKTLSLLLLGILALAAVLSVISVRKESISDRPLHGCFSVVLFLVALCAFVSLISAYAQFQRPVSFQLKWKIAAIAARE